MTTSVATAVPAGTYTIDPVHSRFELRGTPPRHRDRPRPLRVLRGSFEIGDDLASAKAYGSVEAASVDTQEPQRDEHLRSADFFDVERFPRIEFASKEIRPLDEDCFEVVGDLTLHGITREVTLSAEITGTELDPYGNERVGLEALGELNRKDYGMTFNQVLGSGNVLVADKVKLSSRSRPSRPSRRTSEAGASCGAPAFAAFLGDRHAAYACPRTIPAASRASDSARKNAHRVELAVLVPGGLPDRLLDLDPAHLADRPQPGEAAPARALDLRSSQRTL